jgi:hypothetical protein
MRPAESTSSIYRRIRTQALGASVTSLLKFISALLDFITARVLSDVACVSRRALDCAPRPRRTVEEGHDCQLDMQIN